MAKKNKKQHKINNEITVNEVKLVGDNVTYGIYSIREAQSIANGLELDLVLINEQSVPPLCKVLNYDKFIYEKSKIKQPKSLPVKEIRFSLNIGENDLMVKTNHIIEFLSKGHRVKVSLRLKGREMSFTNKGIEILLKLAVDVEKYGNAEAMPKIEGKVIQIFIKPK